LIAADTNALSRMFDGLVDRSTIAARRAMASGKLHLPPVVVTELLSNPAITDTAIAVVSQFPVLAVMPGFWERAGQLRRGLRAEKKAAGLGDCLIAQSCIDHDIPLITYDLDFRHFQPAGLKLA
jgi:predicted nucleic acid-binding protein